MIRDLLRSMQTRSKMPSQLSLTLVGLMTTVGLGAIAWKLPLGEFCRMA